MREPLDMRWIDNRIRDDVQMRSRDWEAIWSEVREAVKAFLCGALFVAVMYALVIWIIPAVYVP